MSTSVNNYNSLKTQIDSLLQKGQEQDGRAVNTILVQTYWHIDKYIIAFEQGRKEKSEYGSELLGTRN
jgi:hypothetical protein